MVVDGFLGEIWREKIELSTVYPQSVLTFPHAFYGYPQGVWGVDNLSTQIVENFWLYGVISIWTRM